MIEDDGDIYGDGVNVATRLEHRHRIVRHMAVVALPVAHAQRRRP